jgi:hypothetical protein
MLLGLAFVSHQLGGFLGVWLGFLLEQTGSYDVVWARDPVWPDFRRDQFAHRRKARSTPQFGPSVNLTPTL